MRINVVRFCAALALLAAGGGASGQVTDLPDTATQYLKAWSFKDFDTMYNLSAAAGTGPIEKTQFYRAAASLPAPASDFRIVSRTISDAREHVYFESGAAIRGSIVVGR